MHFGKIDSSMIIVSVMLLLVVIVVVVVLAAVAELCHFVLWCQLRILLERGANLSYTWDSFEEKKTKDDGSAQAIYSLG